MQALARRVGRLIVHPQAAWAEIAGETTETPRLFGRVTVPLVAAGALTTAVGEALYALLTDRSLLRSVLIGLILYPALRACTVALLGIAGTAIARTLGVGMSSEQSQKLAIWSTTPVLAAALLNVVPLPLAFAWFLAGTLVGAFVYFEGLGVLGDVHREKRVAFVAVALSLFFLANAVVEVPVRLIVWLLL